MDSKECGKKGGTRERRGNMGHGGGNSVGVQRKPELNKLKAMAVTMEERKGHVMMITMCTKRMGPGELGDFSSEWTRDKMKQI